MEIRRLTDADAQAIWDFRATALRVEPEAFGESVEEHLQTTVESVAIRLRSGGDDNFVLGAISDSALVGMIGFYRELRLKGRHRGWIWGMYVAPEWRGQGTGRRLVEEAIRRAEKVSGLHRVLLHVSCTQGSARRLYESLGFRVFGTEPQALQVEGRFIDVDLMGWTVRKSEERV